MHRAIEFQGEIGELKSILRLGDHYFQAPLFSGVGSIFSGAGGHDLMG